MIGKILRIAGLIFGVVLLVVGIREILVRPLSTDDRSRSREIIAGSNSQTSGHPYNPYRSADQTRSRRRRNRETDGGSISGSDSVRLSLKITTTTLPMGVVGNEYRETLTATGGKDPYRWALAGGELPPGLTLNQAGVIAGIPLESGEWRPTIRVRDENGSVARRGLRLLVREQEAEQSKGPLVITAEKLMEGYIGEEYLQKLGVKGGTPPYAWSFLGGSLPAGIVFNQQEGIIFGIPRQTGEFKFSIRVMDFVGNFQDGDYTLVVKDQGLAIITEAISPAVVDEEYSFSFRAEGGIAPYRWSLLSGFLPEGIEFDGDRGEISGLAVKVEESKILIGVTDRDGRADNREFTFQVVEEPFSIKGAADFRISTLSLPSATRGQLYAYQLLAEGGSRPYTWTVTEGDLPPSLALDNETGEMSGVPEKVGQSAFTVTASDDNGLTASAYYLFSVSYQLVYLTTGTLPVGVVGGSYDTTLEASGGTPPYSWNLDSGSLPSGLTLDETAGVITGVVSEEYSGSGTREFVFRVKVSDQAGNYDLAELKMTIRETAEPTPIATPTPGEGEARVSDLTGGVSNGKVGLAWRNPSSPFTAVEIRRKTGSYPQNPYDGALIYRGKSDNIVDTGLVNGTEYFYAVVVYDAGNLPSPIEEGNRLSLTPREVSLFGSRDPFADRVVSYANLSDSYNSGFTWLIGKTPEDTEEPQEDVVAIQESPGGEPPGEYQAVSEGVKTGRVESDSSPDAFTVTGLGGGIEGTFIREAGMEINGRKVYRNGDYYLYYGVYYPTDTSLENRALGAPRGAGSYQGSQDVVSLQAKVYDGDPPCGGTIIVEFTDNLVVDGEGDDFTVFENVFYIDGDESKRFMEPALVYVSQDGENYYRFPCNYSKGHNRGVYNPETYDFGFAGVTPVFSNNGSPDPTDPNVSGGDSFDLDDITAKNLTWIRYIKLKSTGDNWLEDDDGDKIRHNLDSGSCSGLGSSGFDLDAVAAVNY